MVALRADDGSTPPEFYTPISNDAGEWQVTPSRPPAGGVLLQWQNLRPFAIETPEQFRAAPPPALVNMAISDAQATVFETKYHYRFWRPETAIRAGDADGNRLTRVFGPRHHFITLSNPAVAGIVLQYGSFRQITHDVDDARVYGGIHFRFDQEAGAKLGREVGSYLFRHALRKR